MINLHQNYSSIYLINVVNSIFVYKITTVFFSFVFKRLILFNYVGNILALALDNLSHILNYSV